MKRLRGFVRGVLMAAFATLAMRFGWARLRGAPQDLPWTPLDLGEPSGAFTGRKLAGLADHGRECRQLLDRAGVRYQALPPRHAGRCGYDDAVRFAAGGARQIAFAPGGAGVACPVAAALAMWEWNVVQPAAQRRFGSTVTRIDHYGSYSCRRIRGGHSGGWSEHSTANAIDIAGFVLANGARISVVRDWRDSGKKAAFLREVRSGACGLFATVLSPDYNAAHADHLHLDQAARGATGWRACR
jgi:hypothetical protein